MGKGLIHRSSPKVLNEVTCEYRGAYGTLRITAEVVNVCDLVGGSDGSHTCDGISHDG